MNEREKEIELAFLDSFLEHRLKEMKETYSPNMRVRQCK